MTQIDIQTRILEAAEQRFQQYGYNKTTMAEIARECDMSAANLYRYFESKLDIGAALAHQCLLDRESLLVRVIQDENIAASDKLRGFVMAILHYTYNHFDESPKMSELVEAMTIQRPDVVASHNQSKLKLLTQLLEKAKQTGEFEVSNIEQTADAIHSAILLFHFPLTVKMYPLEELELKANNVCDLLLRGLFSR